MDSPNNLFLPETETRIRAIKTAVNLIKKKDACWSPDWTSKLCLFYSGKAWWLFKPEPSKLRKPKNAPNMLLYSCNNYTLLSTIKGGLIFFFQEGYTFKSSWNSSKELTFGKLFQVESHIVEAPPCDVCLFGVTLYFSSNPLWEGELISCEILLGFRNYIEPWYIVRTLVNVANTWKLESLSFKKVVGTIPKRVKSWGEALEPSG